jgi:hypothetical protein
MNPTLSNMNVYEELTALPLHYATREDVIGAMSVGIKFHQCVSLRQSDNSLNNFVLVGQDVIPHVILDLSDPFIKISLSGLTLQSQVHRETNSNCDRWWATSMWVYRGHRDDDASCPPPRTRSG